VITVQPIVYTPDPGRWLALARALGLTAQTPIDDTWTQFVGRGILAVHAVDADEPPQAVDWHALVDDVDALASALNAGAIPFHSAEGAGAGTSLHVDAGGGPELTISAGVVSSPDGPLSVMPIWYGLELDQAKAAYAALGLAPRISSDGGGWSDFTADGGGIAALHTGEARVELSFEYTGDLDALAETVTDAGFPARVVDEAYNRTLLVDAPGGATLWVNGTIHDLYGYHRAG
jgi:hypothetical protein